MASWLQTPQLKIKEMQKDGELQALVLLQKVDG